MTNAIAAVGIGAGGNLTALQAATGCECVGREGKTAERKRDRKNNNAPTQHELGIHHKLPSSAARATDTSEQALFERGKACLSSDQGVRAIAFDGVCKENAGAH
jgi:hypothetical protein